MTHDEGTRLWLPPMALAGCVRSVMLRDTRGRPLTAQQRENYFPATPLVSLFWWLDGRSDWLATPGFAPPPAEPRHAPVLCAGPFTLPTHTRNPGEMRAFKLLLLADAFTALTGVAVDRLVNQVTDAATVLPPDWLAWAQAVSTAGGDEARLALVEQFLLPRWQALGADRPGHRYAAWTEALAVRAATSAAGRSLRQLERRIKAWAGLPLRELRAVSRAERAFYAVAAAEHRPGFNWADIAAEAEYADEGLFTLRQWVALRTERPRARRKAEPGWLPGEHLQRGARPFCPQPEGKARRQGPLRVAALARVSMRAARCALIGPWRRAFATHCRSVNRP